MCRNRDDDGCTRGYWLWLCEWWRSAVPRRESAANSQPSWPRLRWRYEPPQTTHSEAKKPSDVWYQSLISLILTLSLSFTHTHLIWAEAHVAKLQDRGEDGPDGGDLISMQTDGLKALNQKLEVLLVLLPLQFTETTLERKTKCDMYNRKRARENIIKKKKNRGESSLCSLVCDVLGSGSNRSRLLAGRAPVCPSRSNLPAAHRTRGSSSPHWPTEEMRQDLRWHWMSSWLLMTVYLQHKLAYQKQQLNEKYRCAHISGLLTLHTIIKNE